MIHRSSIVVLPMLLLLGACQERTKIADGRSFVAANHGSDSSIGRGLERVCWATDEMLIATARNRLVQAFDVTSGEEIWRREWPSSIEAIACSRDHVYVALNATYPLDWEQAESIRRLDALTGADSTPEGVPQPFLPDALVWGEEAGALCVVKNEELWVYSADLLAVSIKTPYSGVLPFVSHADGIVLLAEDSGTCTAVNLEDGSLEHIHGPPGRGRDNLVAMDAPFLSNAFMAGDGRLIRVVDNSWATGRVYFHASPESAAKEADSKNGHAVAAVHWPTGRLAISGTSKDLVLFSTEGEELGEKKRAAPERVYSLAFSPSGRRIAALSSDGTIRTFELP